MLASSAIRTAATYTIAPFLLVIAGEMSLLAIVWVSAQSRIISGGAALMLFTVIASLHVGLIGAVWVAAVCSDRSELLFRGKVSPIIGVFVTVGIGAVLFLFIAFVEQTVFDLLSLSAAASSGGIIIEY